MVSFVWEAASQDAAATERWGEVLGALLAPGDVVLLAGELGAGKTTFARGVARGAGVKEPVTSPTFTFVHEYVGRLPLYHCDLYRWPPGADVAELGLPEYLFGEGATLVEWPDRLGAWQPETYLRVELRTAAPGRRLAVRGVGGRGQELASAWRGAAEAAGLLPLAGTGEE